MRVLGPTPDNMNTCLNTELSSHEGTRCQFNGGTGLIKFAVGRIRPHGGLGIDVHQNFYVVVNGERTRLACWRWRLAIADFARA